MQRDTETSSYPVQSRKKSRHNGPQPSLCGSDAGAKNRRTNNYERLKEVAADKAMPKRQSVQAQSGKEAMHAEAAEIRDTDKKKTKA